MAGASEKTISTDESKPPKDPGGILECSCCGSTEKFHYKGSNPPFARSVQFSEEAYIMKDPFAPSGQGQCLIIGGDCSVCSKPVCCASECSLFYTRRFCMSCAKVNLPYFPPQVANKIK